MLRCSLIPFVYLVDAVIPWAAPTPHSLLLFPMVGWGYSSNDGEWWWYSSLMEASAGFRVEGGKVGALEKKKREIKVAWNKKKRKWALREENDGIIKGEGASVYHAAHAEESWSDYKSKCLCYISVQIFWQYIACFPRATWQLAPHQADRCTD